MFSMPSLPNDSLYKFCAVSGVTMIALTVFLYLHEQSELARDYTKSKPEFATARIDIELKLMEAIENDQTLTAEERAAKQKQARERAEAAEKQFHEEWQPERLKTDITRRIDRFLGPVGMGLVIFGAVLATYGFANWWGSQRKIDQLIDLQLKEAKRKEEAAVAA